MVWEDDLISGWEKLMAKATIAEDWAKRRVKAWEKGLSEFFLLSKACCSRLREEYRIERALLVNPLG